jgi:hypothetical protein
MRSLASALALLSLWMLAPSSAAAITPMSFAALMP